MLFHRLITHFSSLHFPPHLSLSEHRIFTMAAEVPRDAHNLLQAINLQIESINVDQHSTNDEVHALNQQLAELQTWKREIEANPSSATLKRAAEEPADEPIPKRRKLGPIMSECSTCMEEGPTRDVAKLKCCGTRYCKTCFQAWFTAALDTKQLPKCCDVGIEPKRYPSFLTVVVKKKYKQVTAELDAERKIWCANPACGVVIKVQLLHYHHLVTPLMMSFADQRRVRIRAVHQMPPKDMCNMLAGHIRP